MLPDGEVVIVWDKNNWWTEGPYSWSLWNNEICDVFEHLFAQRGSDGTTYPETDLVLFDTYFSDEVGDLLGSPRTPNTVMRRYGPVLSSPVIISASN